MRKSWKPEQSKHFKALRQDLSDGADLVLFLGSGINAGLAPQWSKLVHNLLKRAVGSAATESGCTTGGLMEKFSPRMDQYAVMALIKQLLGKNRWSICLKNELYRSFNLDEMKEYCNEKKKYFEGKAPDTANKNDNLFSMLYATARLCLLRQVRAVVTYNYDNLLEQMLECIQGSEEGMKGRKIRSVCGGISWNPLPANILPIFHPHGFLPDPSNPVRINDRVVLGMDEYLETFTEPDGWHSSPLLHYLRNYTVLYTGCSMTDWNMLRLLQRSMNPPRHFSHYALLMDFESEFILQNPNAKTTSADHDEFLILNQMRATLLESVGVRAIYAEKDWRGLAQCLQKLTDKPAQ